ncbi:MAG TPA: NfeD family protein [Pseudonocardiaceae bacterium]|nr:NfeD family protein [Pseudonocardiaceae bacterium]
MAAVVWLVAGLLLIAAEVLSGDFVLIMLGVGALVAAGSGALGASIWVEIAAFAGASLALITVARPMLRRRLHPAPVPTNAEALLGDKAVVVNTVDAGGGKVKLRGELWSARAFDETEVLEPGQTVTVMNISGATAIVLGER